jgi:membrane-anchored protein YejM (alkaline phosphatase superfamily)
VFNLALTAPFVFLGGGADAFAGFFAVLVWVTYAFVYLLPALLVIWLLGKALGSYWTRRLARLLGVIAALLGGGVSSALFADLKIFKMFEFHINGFVWNLLTTPGGVSSMGADRRALAMFGAVVLLLLAFHQFAAWWLQRGGWMRCWLDTHFAGRYRWFLYAFVALTVSERVAYAGAYAQAYTPVLRAASAFPLYAPTTATHLLQRFGVAAQRQTSFAVDANGDLRYPKVPLHKREPEKRYNIVWLVAESWRGDMLTPEIMPATHAFAQRACSFERHYSGGNGTRWGIFTQFYGLYGNYWFNVLEHRRSPVLVDRLQELGYQLHVSTSSAFSYPEFDKTVWVNVPSSSLHLPEGPGPGWRWDRKAVDRIEKFLDQRDRTHPFFVFHFFESAHARYYFPKESVIREPYLEDFNYATMNLAQDIGLIFNRYINSVHHLDSQLGRVVGALQRRGLLEDTVVVITGDHGEEFLEKGHWGHNSQFTEEQTHVPLVIFVPGQKPRRVVQRSSHLDLPATILPLLGVTNDPGDYSLGCDLLKGCERKALVFGDWDRIGYADERYKLVFALSSAGYGGNRITTADDQPVKDEQQVRVEYQAAMVQLLKEMAEFGRQG